MSAEFVVRSAHGTRAAVAFTALVVLLMASGPAWSADNTPPSCALTAVIAGPPKQLQITVQDSDDGMSSVQVLLSDNATVAVPAFTVGDTSPLVIVATKVDQSQPFAVSLRATDVAGNSTSCDFTDGPTPTPTPTPSATPTNTPTNTPTATPTGTPTATPTATPTNTRIPIGGACSVASQCASPGFCVDSVCCDTACTDPLMRCNLAGQIGTCASDAAAAPTLTPWGLLVAALLLSGVAAFALRYRPRSH
jgi:hypothetical protein